MCRSAIDVEVTGSPLEYQKAYCGRDQQFDGTRLAELLHGALFKRIPGADARKQEKQHHEPGVQNVHHDILRLLHRVRVEASDPAEHAFVVVKIENVVRTYKMGDNEVQALKGVSFEIEQGEFLAIMGPSGSGKSTCMNMIGCLDRPTSGTVQINGKYTSEMSEKELAVLRNQTIGFVFQQYHLLPGMSVLENVMLPLRYQGIERSKRAELAKFALEKVNLLDGSYTLVFLYFY